MNSGIERAPETVELVYRVVGNTHVFSSRGIQGLVHTGSAERKKAFTQVIECLNEHVQAVYGNDVHYHAEYTYDEFADHLDSGVDILANFITLRLDAPIAA